MTAPDSIQALNDFLAPYEELYAKINLAENKNEASQYYAEYKQYVLATLTMPYFYTHKPEKPVYRIHAEQPFQYKVYSEDGEVIHEDTNITTAYDLAHKLGDIIFSGDYNHVDHRWDKGLGSLFVPIEGSKNSRMLISHTDSDSISLDYMSYIYFLKTAREYLQNPNDFLTAWYFVDTHPFAWHIHEAGSYDWAQKGHVSKVWLQPSLNKENTVTFMLETGAAIDPDRTNHYHDLRLDIYAPTYNDSIIKLAAKIHKFFYLDGVERENIEYQKSALELELEQAFEDYNDDDEDNT